MPGRRVGLEQYFPWENAPTRFDWELEPNGIRVSHWLREHPKGTWCSYTAMSSTANMSTRVLRPRPGRSSWWLRDFEEYGFDALPAFSEPAISPVSEPVWPKNIWSVPPRLKLGIHTHTQFRTCLDKGIRTDPFAEIHPATASELGIQDRDWIVVESPEGSIRVRARVRPTACILGSSLSTSAMESPMPATL